MRWIFQLRLSLLWLFKQPLLLWIRLRVVPTAVPEGLNLHPNKPVLYLLKAPSTSDLCALEQVCKEHGLPSSQQRLMTRLPKNGDEPEAACMYLPFLTRTPGQRRKDKPALGERVLDEAMAAQDYDLQIVPVSVYWGRDPGHEHSLVKLMFTDRENPGVIRKFFTVLAQGRNTLVSFGQPIQLRDFVDPAMSAENSARKLARVLRVHYRRHRDATLGPTLPRHADMVRRILQNPSVREAMAQVQQDKGYSAEKVHKLAWKYGEEIAADYSSATISFLDRFLGWLWNKLYDGVEVYHSERLRAIAQDHEVVYMPSHRSHMDYLLISYVLYFHGLVPPHIAAGINLNFWPVGRMLRKGGAFYIRRSFSGQPLYTAVFRAYLDLLLAGGYSVNFFPEGGRSRTGRLLKPKTGMLSMAMDSFVRNHDRPIVLVPVYVGYDKLAEGGSYAKELSGGSKKKESAGELLKAGKLLKQKYGKAYISFGEPVELGKYLDAEQSDWRQQPERRQEWLAQQTTELASTIMQRINGAAVVNPVSIVAAMLLASPQHAVAEDELIAQIDICMDFLRRQPYGQDISLPRQSAAELIEYASSVAGLLRIPHPWGDVIATAGRDAVKLTYYRNNIQHLLALPSVLASRFQAHSEQSEQELVEACIDLYPLLQSEFHLRWQLEEVPAVVAAIIQTLVELGLLSRGDAGQLQRPAISSREFSSLTGIGRVLQETLERHAMTARLLAEARSQGSIDRVDFEKRCQLVAERLAVISGRNPPEFSDKNLFRDYVALLIESDVLQVNEDDSLELDERLDEIAERAMSMISLDAQQVLMQLSSMPKALEDLSANKGE